VGVLREARPILLAEADAEVLELLRQSGTQGLEELLGECLVTADTGQGRDLVTGWQGRDGLLIVHSLVSSSRVA
jgi:hypothetical protein